MSRWHTPAQHLTESLPPGLTDEDRYCISYIAVLLAFGISHDVNIVTSLAKNEQIIIKLTTTTLEKKAKQFSDKTALHNYYFSLKPVALA